MLVEGENRVAERCSPAVYYSHGCICFATDILDFPLQWYKSHWLVNDNNHHSNLSMMKHSLFIWKFFLTGCNIMVDIFPVNIDESIDFDRCIRDHLSSIVSNQTFDAQMSLKQRVRSKISLGFTFYLGDQIDQ